MNDSHSLAHSLRDHYFWRGKRSSFQEVLKPVTFGPLDPLGSRCLDCSLWRTFENWSELSFYFSPFVERIFFLKSIEGVPSAVSGGFPFFSMKFTQTNDAGGPRQGGAPSPPILFPVSHHHLFVSFCHWQWPWFIFACSYQLQSTYPVLSSPPSQPT